MELKTYDPKEVNVIIGGSIMNSWNTVNVEQEEDDNIMSAGTTGEITRTKNANKLGTITVVLPQTSGDNSILTGLAIGGEVFSIMIQDKSGSSVHVMAEAVVGKKASSEYAKESGEREWTFMGGLSTDLPNGN